MRGEDQECSSCLLAAANVEAGQGQAPPKQASITMQTPLSCPWPALPYPTPTLGVRAGAHLSAASGSLSLATRNAVLRTCARARAPK